MSLSVRGGAALPVTAVVGSEPQGNVARPVHTYHVAPSAGVIASPTAQPVVYITSGQLIQNGGTYYLEGAPTAMPVYDGHSLGVAAGAPLPVYEA